MNVTVRQKVMKDGKMASLYLDIYYSRTERYKEWLQMQVYVKPTDQIQRNHNKNKKELAESIASKRFLDIKSGEHGVKLKVKKHTQDFIQYFEILTESRKQSGVNFGHWNSTLKWLKEYSELKKRRFTFNDITVHWLEDFKQYLLTKISTNSASAYFDKIKHCMGDAERDKLITSNVANNVKSIKLLETNIEYLTEDEFNKIVKATCKKPILKTAFIFSCLTGLRWSDIYKLTWSEIRFDEDSKWHIMFQHKKTKNYDKLQIAENARQIIGQTGKPDERVFKGLTYNAWNNIILREWMMCAGITKHITFHCARHTYGTLLLTKGEQLPTIQVLMRHSDYRTTAIYAKVINSKKVDAVNKLSNLNIDFE